MTLEELETKYKLKVIRTKYDGRCGLCKGSIEAGDKIFWNPLAHNTHHYKCGVDYWNVEVKRWWHRFTK